MAKYVSRKYRIALVTMTLITLGFIATGFFITLAPQYDAFVMALLAGAGLYGGINVANKHVLGKHGVLSGNEEGSEPSP
jgi:hypothetical protein